MVDVYKIIFSSVLLCMFLHWSRAEDLKKCVTPSGQEGVCKSISRCPFIRRVALRRLISREDVDYLRRASCGFNGSEPMVCCAEPAVCPPRAAPPEPGSGCCGLTATPSFKQGTFFPAIDQYPWMAVFEYDYDNTTGLLACGVLISSRYVLTTAANVRATHGLVPKRVRLGEFNTSNPGPDCEFEGPGRRCTDGALTVPIERTIVHPGYDPRLDEQLHDIALFRLSIDVPYTDFIRPICLPTMDLTEAHPNDLKYLRLHVAGWGTTGRHSGRSQLLRHVGLPFAKRRMITTVSI